MLFYRILYGKEFLTSYRITSQNSIKKKDPDISKLTEHHFNTGHRILWEETEIIGREPNWKARKKHEAAAIMEGGNEVFSSQSVEIDPIWKPIIEEINIYPQRSKETAPLRRSRRLIERNSSRTRHELSVKTRAAPR
jgi:hypothetical protein